MFITSFNSRDIDAFLNGGQSDDHGKLGAVFDAEAAEQTPRNVPGTLTISANELKLVP